MNLKKYRNTMVFLLDMLIILMSSSVLYFILNEYEKGTNSYVTILFPHIMLLICCEAISQYIFRTYESLWRYAENKEYLMLYIGGFTGFVMYLAVDYFILGCNITILYPLASFALSMLGMSVMRLLYRQLRIRYQISRDKSKEISIPIFIIGAGQVGIMLHDEIVNSASSYKTVCFIDDSVEKIGKRIHDIPVKGPIAELNKIYENTPVEEIIIAIPSLTPDREKSILDICSNLKCKVRILPNTMELLKKDSRDTLWNNVRDVNIEELLGRQPNLIDDHEEKDFLRNKVVMVTGGGGSIGSELCRQIAKKNPTKLIIVDNYENNAYDIQQELLQTYGEVLNLVVEIASVSNRDKIFQLFERHHPQIIFHAAAHKHVPLMESCPEEAVRNNIFGTYYMVLASEKYEVEKFIFISTDKAVNPTNVMGASKRFCEMILQSRKGISKTEFVAVRFGNVLGSNGSVIPLFQKQIANGGPVTITDKRIIRYFMTISEAVALVLQAALMANRAEIYILDMGDPVKIITLAENMIRLSGLEPYTEIPIIETGLRPGEKLYEELLMNSKELVATANNKIFIEKQNCISQLEIEEDIKLLAKAIASNSPVQVKKTLKQLVPTYKDAEEVNSKMLKNM